MSQTVVSRKVILSPRCSDSLLDSRCVDSVGWGGQRPYFIPLCEGLSLVFVRPNGLAIINVSFMKLLKLRDV